MIRMETLDSVTGVAENRARSDAGPVRLKRLKYKGSGGFYVLVLFKYPNRRVFAEDGVFGDQDFLDLFLRGSIIHHIQHDFFQDGPKSSGARFLSKGLPSDGPQRPFGEFELDLFKREQFFILLGEGVSRLGKDTDQRAFVEFVERGDDGQPSDKFRNQAVLQKIFWLNMRQQFTQPNIVAARGYPRQIPSISDSGAAR